MTSNAPSTAEGITNPSLISSPIKIVVIFLLILLIS